jgi:hypothetical protein
MKQENQMPKQFSINTKATDHRSLHNYHLARFLVRLTIEEFGGTTKQRTMAAVAGIGLSTFNRLANEWAEDQPAVPSTVNKLRRGYMALLREKYGVPPDERDLSISGIIENDEAAKAYAKADADADAKAKADADAKAKAKAKAQLQALLDEDLEVPEPKPDSQMALDFAKPEQIAAEARANYSEALDFSAFCSTLVRAVAVRDDMRSETDPKQRAIYASVAKAYFEFLFDLLDRLSGDLLAK